MLRYLETGAGAAIVAAMLIGQAAAQTPAPPYYGPMHGEWMWTMMGSGRMWIMPLVFLVVMAVLVTLAVRLISPRPAGNTRPSEGSGALALLDARYARGEIGREEYLEKKKDLVA